MTIGSNEGANAMDLQDDFTFNNLSDKSKKDFMEQTVSFQGRYVNVRDLLLSHNQEETTMDSLVIKELIEKKNKITIPSCDTDTSRFKKSLYIERGIMFPHQLDEHFWAKVLGCFNDNRQNKGKLKRLASQNQNEGSVNSEDKVPDRKWYEKYLSFLQHKNKVALEENGEKRSANISKARTQPQVSLEWLRNQCAIDSNGCIDWLVEDKLVQEEIWEAITNILKENSSWDSLEIVKEGQLINEKEWKRRAVIISGVAGSGKSSILSQYCEEIENKKNREEGEKTNYKTKWVIRINLVEYSSALSKFETTAIEFSTGLPNVVDQTSPFSHWLLRRRLETGDRIVLMLDGFDEINELCQRKVIQLMKSITEMNSARLYVTTRSHMANDLQFQLGQLAYYLKNFDVEDQKKCLTLYWRNAQKDRMFNDLENKLLLEFADSLVKKVCEDLNDDERDLIGIPLQCRILAECFDSQVLDIVKQGNVTEKAKKMKLNDILDDQSFDLAKLYELLMETKRKVFREMKLRLQNNDDLGTVKALMIAIENYLKSLAVATICEEHCDILLPLINRYESEEDEDEEQQHLNELCIRFGLTDVNSEGNVEFLHRSYAEYLVAKYLHKGFQPDDKKNNKLLDNEAVCDLIIEEILSKNEYDGVQIFLDSLLKDIVSTEAKLTSNRFKQLAKLISKKPSFFHCIHETSNTFLFFCNCLDAIFTKEHVRRNIMEPFFDLCCTMRHQTALCFVNNRVFQRCLDYYENKMGDKLRFFVLINSHFFNLDTISLWNHENAKMNVKSLLNFMIHHQGNLEVRHRFYDENVFWNNMVHNFILDKEYDESYLEQFVKIMSKIHVAKVGDTQLANFIKETIVYTSIRLQDLEDCNAADKSCKIRVMLETLRKLDRKRVLEDVALLVYILEPCEVFASVYQLCLTEEEEIDHLRCPLYIEDSQQKFVDLYQKASSGKADILQQALREILQTPSLGDSFLSFRIENLTPFCVAAINGHEVVCRAMVQLFKQEIQSESYLKGKNGFINNALRISFVCENEKNVQNGF